MLHPKTFNQKAGIVACATFFLATAAGGRYFTAAAAMLAPQPVEVKKITASDAVAGHGFGGAVSMSGNTMVVAATGSTHAVYIYERSAGGGDNWVETRKLTSPDPTSNFGASVGINGDTIIVGASFEQSFRGNAYLYGRNIGGPGNWGLIKTLIGSDSAADDRFGVSVSIDRDRVIVGAWGDDSVTGSAYVFERNRGGANNWGQAKKLMAEDRNTSDEYGVKVAVDGDRVVVGADRTNTRTGSAFIYERNRGGVDNWGLVKKLTASNASPSAFFGIAVDMEGDTIVVGAERGNGDSGAAYVFYRNKGGTDNWGEVKKVQSPLASQSDRFGNRVALSGDMVVVGAQREDELRGNAYVFDRHKGGADNWGQFAKLSASDGLSQSFFGVDVAIEGITILIGASNASGQGAGYIYRAVPEAVTVSAASFQRTALAPEMIASVFSADLATGTQLGGAPLPTNLLGTTVTVTDSIGSQRSAQIFFVSPTQVNFYMPSGTAQGPATIKVVSGSGQISVGELEITLLSPGFFTADSSGKGIAAALALRVRNGQQTYENISQYNDVTKTFEPIPIDLGPVGDQVYLVMYGSGFRFRSADSNVNVKLGGRTLQSLFTGGLGSFVGLDQLNISPLPRDMAGAGVVNVEVAFDGKAASTVTVAIK